MQHKKISSSLKKKIKNIVKLINQSNKPLLVIGHGVKLSGCENNLKKFIHKNKIPYLTTWACIDMFEFKENLMQVHLVLLQQGMGTLLFKILIYYYFCGARMSP